MKYQVRFCAKTWYLRDIFARLPLPWWHNKPRFWQQKWMMRLRLNRAVLTPFLGQFWLANHSMLYIHISRPLPTISVTHIKMFHAWDTFPCFFGFRNRNDTEINYNTNSVHHWHRYIMLTTTVTTLRSRSLKVMRGRERTTHARNTRGKKDARTSLACRTTSGLRSRSSKGNMGSWKNGPRYGDTRG